jgi:hypothetical protein
MHSSPLNKRERQGVSFALIGRTQSDCALQASDFRVSTADRVRALSADCPLLRLRNQRDERPGAPSSALKVSPVNERKRVRFFTASPVIKHEADRGKPGISSPLNKRARQLKLGAVTRAFATETAI